MPLAEAEKWLDHLGSCSPCYRDFSQFREAYQRRRNRTFFAIAASILIAVGIAGWALLQRHNEALVAQTAVLDLRNRSVARGTEPNPDEQPLEVSRAATRWNILLALGSSEGSYEVRVSTRAGESVLTTSGVASLNNQVTSLQAAVSISEVRPGQYILQVRKAGSEWNSYPLQVQ